MRFFFGKNTIFTDANTGDVGEFEQDELVDIAEVYETFIVYRRSNGQEFIVEEGYEAPVSDEFLASIES